MTRINLIDPELLSNQHLLAEHREIKRIPNMILNGRGIISNLPEKYTMGKGHVRFFYNKLMFLFIRYLWIKHECMRRNFNITNYEKPFIDAMIKYPVLAQDWVPSPEEIEISKQRIQEKLKMKPNFYKWY